ncbi:hypothetical protein [Bordetella petrii]|uniref:hypothetical protein n=1 Tax=Bordetella petrii TaxID=94624 RepID=UPI001E52F974|nr:hypothetical protein [Bordetella petrii]MCD0502424.1 hypothetical protein [Bordetella petrii]
METLSGRVVNGFKVHCDIMELPTGHFRLVLSTRKLGLFEEDRIWDLPRVRVYTEHSDAERDARAMLRSIRQVNGASGEPNFAAQGERAAMR